MDDDDTDFTPSSSQNTSSNLASLFGFTKQPLQGNSSLTYSAPKAPKREPSPAKKQPEEKIKGKILLSKAVQAYKLVKRNYESQGVLGIVISGNHSSRIYEFILYKKTNERLIQIRISDNFTVTLSPNKYVSFYDNNKKNWSIMFRSDEDVQEFSQKVAICKFYSQLESSTNVLIQDLEPASQQKANASSIVSAMYSAFMLTPEKLSKLKEDVKEEIKLSNYGFTQLSNGLIGCAEKCKRVIIIPHSLSGPWLSELGPNTDLLIEIKIVKIVTESENVVNESKPPADRRSESPIDSSAEETSVKARGALIKEELASTKSQKAILISRMARMGQATLPVKQGLSTEPSDSDEESALTSHPKPRMPRSRNTGGNALNSSVSQTQNQGSPQQLSVYQNDLAWHQAQLGKLGVAFQQLIPVSSSPVSSPTTDPNMSVYASESRIQAAELRMGMSKISDKLDLVWNKIQHLGGAGFEKKTHQQTLLDSGGILTSIQNLITENNNLKEKVEEQKTKIEQQNDRIFNLLELNHKYLEQNSTTHEKQSANESKLKTEMESLQRKELEMESTTRMALDRMKNLEGDLAKSEQLNKELKKKVEELEAEAAGLKRNLEGNNDEKTKELENFKEKMTKASETVIKLKDKLREVVPENESLKTVIQNQKEEIETGNQEIKNLKTKNEQYEKTVEGLKKHILDEESKAESRVANLSRVIAKLEGENKLLLKKAEKEGDSKEVKSVLLKIFSGLKGEFSESREHSAAYILNTVRRIFNNEVTGSFEVEETPESAKTTTTTAAGEPSVVPAPRTSLQNAEPKAEIKDSDTPKEPESKKEEVKELLSPQIESESKKEEKKETDNQKNKEEVDSRYKSYDQGWRTAKPPPPPLFDDDDDDDDEWPN